MVIPFSKKETGIQGLENRYMTLAVVAGVITEERWQFRVRRILISKQTTPLAVKNLQQEGQSWLILHVVRATSYSSPLTNLRYEYLQAEKVPDSSFTRLWAVSIGFQRSRVPKFRKNSRKTLCSAFPLVSLKQLLDWHFSSHKPPNKHFNFPCMWIVEWIIERFGLEGTFRGHLAQPPLQWARSSSTRSGFLEPRPAWPRMFPGMGHLPPLWATCSSVSLPSLYKRKLERCRWLHWGLGSEHQRCWEITLSFRASVSPAAKCSSFLCSHCRGRWELLGFLLFPAGAGFSECSALLQSQSLPLAKCCESKAVPDTGAGWKQVLQTVISMDGLILQKGQGRGE